MNPDTSGAKLTYEDFLLLPDDGLRHELIDGEHYVSPSPNVDHQQILGNLYYLIRAWLAAQPEGRVLLAPFDVVLTNLDVVEPDLLYLSHARAQAILTSSCLRGAPELAVEIGSPSTRRRDQTIKKRLYERAGMDEYWFVDPEIDVIRVYRRSGAAFEPPLELSRDGGDVLTTPLLPGLELALAEIFRE